MNDDWTRKHDIEEMMNLRKGASNRAEYDKYTKKMYEMAHESVSVKKYRDQLARAIRANDRDAVVQAQHEIKKIKLNESYGKANVYED
jgi:hypothetical protein